MYLPAGKSWDHPLFSTKEIVFCSNITNNLFVKKSQKSKNGITTNAFGLEMILSAQPAIRLRRIPPLLKVVKLKKGFSLN